jgi:small subunit ribosomal protein S9
MATEVKFATGRRKQAVARVRLIPGTGRLEVNGKPLDEYFFSQTLVNDLQEPLKVTDNLGKFDVVATVRGGGSTGQAGAVRLGIARALVRVDESLRQPLRAKGLLTRDPRAKERKKYGQPGARKRFQFSKR